MPRLLSIAFLLAAATSSAAPMILTGFNSSVSESFDLLAKTGTTNPPPADWAWTYLETGSGANTTYATGTGSSATGNTYSFGLSGADDRALGTLRTASLISVLGVSILNQTGATLTSLEVGYTGEQWRLGATGRADRLDFAFSLDATSLNNGTWTEVNDLDFTGPTTTGALGALNGSAAANQTIISHTLTGLSIPAGATFWMRWADFEALGSDDGLAIDDFSLRALPAPTVAPPQGVPDSLPVGALVAALGGLLLARGRAQADSCR